jgi:hypothetical protein
MNCTEYYLSDTNTQEYQISITGNMVTDNISNSAAGYASGYVPFYVLHHHRHWYEDKTESY